MPVEIIPVTDRASWLRRRSQDLTASDIAAVAGVDPRRTALQVYAEKAGLLMKGDTDNNIMQRGRWMEAAVVEMLRDRYPDWEIKRAGVYLSDSDIRMGATPDVVVVDPKREGIGNVQCKVVAGPEFDQHWIDEEPPIGYQIQTLTEAMMLERSGTTPVWAAVAALVVTTYSAKPVFVDVPRHAGAEANILDVVQRFWHAVDTATPPKADYARDGEVIRQINRAGRGPSIDLSRHNRIGELAAERLAWKDRGKKIDGALDIIDAEIMDILGEHEIAEHPQFNITWKRQKREGYTVQPGESRVLRVSAKRGKGKSEDSE